MIPPLEQGHQGSKVVFFGIPAWPKSLDGGVDPLVLEKKNDHKSPSNPVLDIPGTLHISWAKPWKLYVKFRGLSLKDLKQWYENNSSSNVDTCRETMYHIFTCCLGGLEKRPILWVPAHKNQHESGFSFVHWRYRNITVCPKLQFAKMTIFEIQIQPQKGNCPVPGAWSWNNSRTPGHRSTAAFFFKMGCRFGPKMRNTQDCQFHGKHVAKPC
jgi:hypothetical protein